MDIVRDVTPYVTVVFQKKEEGKSISVTAFGVYMEISSCKT
jgi:hypothetical protein